MSVIEKSISISNLYQRRKLIRTLRFLCRGSDGDVHIVMIHNQGFSPGSPVFLPEQKSTPKFILAVLCGQT